MKTPPGFLGAALVFWGWQTSLLIPSLIMAVIIEGSGAIKWKWDFSTQDYNRVADLCALIFMGIFIYRLGVDRSPQTILAVMQLIPLPSFPLLAAQMYGASGGVDTSALFYSARMKRKRNPDLPRNIVLINYPYALICILAASAANVRSIWFYAGVFTFFAWALWTLRSKRYSITLWAGLAVMAGIIGFFGQILLHDLHVFVEKTTIDWYSRSITGQRDPYKVITAIGDVGSLKLSSRIVMRISSESGYGVLGHLRNACYNSYNSGNWIARKSGFRLMAPDRSQAGWTLSDGAKIRRNMNISMYLHKGRGLLSLPNGASKIKNLPAGKVEKNPYGAVRVDEGPGLVDFQVSYGQCTAQIKPPYEDDLVINEKERPTIKKIADQLGLSSKTTKQKIGAARDFFLKNFKYSLELDEYGKNKTPLANFLLSSKTGHCEYFASATVLLLRQAGVPARYATGFSVQEAGMGGQWIIRARHAHAWALVYVDGIWIDVDTTPGVWVEMENKNASSLQGVYDVLSWCWWKFSQWRASESQGESTNYLVWILASLAVFFVWRLFLRKRVGKKTSTKKISAEILRLGQDSEFYLIEQRISQWGYVRNSGENLSQWVSRLEKSALPEACAQSLVQIVRLHCKYRFDPMGLTQKQRSDLQVLVKLWLEKYPDSPKNEFERKIMKISEATFIPKCLSCGADANVKGKCENSMVVCPGCGKKTSFDEYQQQFEDWLAKACCFDDDDL